MKYKKMSAIFGAVIFTALTVFFVTIIWLAESRVFFTRDYIVYMKFKDVSGLKNQAPIYLRGFKIGRVRGVRFKKDYVLVRTDINKHYSIPKGSRAEIVALNILGEKAVRVIPPPPPYEKFLESRDEIEGQNKDIMLEAKKVLESLKEPLKKRYSSTVGKIQGIAKGLDELIKSTKKQMAGLKMKENMDKLGNAADEVGSIARENREGVKKTISRLDETLKDMDKTLIELKKTSEELRNTLASLNKGQGTAGGLLKERETLDELNKSLDELNKLIEDIKKNPKKYFKFSIF